MESVQVIVNMSGELLVVWKSIQEGKDMCYYDIAQTTRLALSTCHIYVRALRDMGLVEIVDGKKRSKFARKWIRPVKTQE